MLPQFLHLKYGKTTQLSTRDVIHIVCYSYFAITATRLFKFLLGPYLLSRVTPKRNFFVVRLKLLTTAEPRSPRPNLAF